MKPGLVVLAVAAVVACSSDKPAAPTFGAPTNVRTAIVGGTVRLTWGSVVDAVGYKVYMAEVGGVRRTNVTTLTGNMTHSELVAVFDHPAGLTSTTKYFFVVTAVRADSTESSESCEVSAKIGTNETSAC